jgi:hypothetical protein
MLPDAGADGTGTDDAAAALEVAGAAGTSATLAVDRRFLPPH